MNTKPGKPGQPEPISEEQFNSLDSIFRKPDRLIAAFRHGEQTWILASYWPAHDPHAQFYLGPVYRPDKDGGGGSFYLQAFLERHGKELTDLGLGKQLTALEQGLLGELEEEHLITRMRADWTDIAYHQQKNETSELAGWLGKSEDSTANRPSPAPQRDVSEATQYVSGLRLFLLCLPVALVSGYLFGIRIDNASPVDGAMIGFVTGVFLYLFTRLLGCRTLWVACKAGLAVSIVMILIGHIQGYRLQRDVIEARTGQSYEYYLAEALQENSRYTFLAHLRAYAKSGTHAFEKPFPYLASVEVYRQGWWVWFAWLRQLIWCVFFTWIAAFFGFEHHLAREKVKTS